MSKMTVQKLAGMIDLACLGFGKTFRDLETTIRLAERFEVASVCCNPDLLRECTDQLKGSPIRPSTVIDFPHGASSTKVRQAMVEQALEDSNSRVEIDIVAQLQYIFDWQPQRLESDLQTLIKQVRSGAINGDTKVILETALLEQSRIEDLCKICAHAGAGFVKTSTGFGPKGGASIEAVKIMRKACNLSVKASGGIRTGAFALELAQHCQRLGMSAIEAVIGEAESLLST